MPGNRRRAAALFAEALQVALADGLELACTMALDMASKYREGRLPEEGSAETLEAFTELVREAVVVALARAEAQRRRDEAG